MKIVLSKRNVAVAAICILIAAVLILTACFFLIKPSARDFYLKAEGKNIKNYAQQLKDSYKEFYNENKPFMDNSYKSRYEISADIESSDDKFFGVKNSKAIMDILRKCKLIIDYQNNPAKHESLTNAGIMLEKAPLIDAKVITGNGQTAITVPVLLPDKYFTFSQDNLDKIYDKLNIPARPKLLLKTVDIATALKFSDKELDDVIKNYSDYFSNMIDNKDVKYGSKTIVKAGSKEFEGTEVLVELDKAKVEKLFKGILEKAVLDETLMKLTFQNYDAITTLLEKAGIFQALNEFYKGGFLSLDDDFKTILAQMSGKKDINSVKSSIKKLAAGLSFPDGLKMTLVIDSSGNILSRKINTTMKTGEGESITYNIYTGSNDIKNNNFDSIIFDLSVEVQNKNGEKILRSVKVDNTQTVAGDNQTDAKNSIKYERQRNGKEEFSAGIYLDKSFKTDFKTQGGKDAIKYEILINYALSGKTDKIQGELNTAYTSNEKKKTRSSTSNITINANMPSINLPDSSIKIGLVSEDKFNTSFSLPKVEASNSICLDNISDVHVESIEKEIFKSLGQFYADNQPLVDAVTKK